MENETYLEHIFVNFTQRKITIVDDEGYDEVIQYRFDDEGAEGFHETITSFKKTSLTNLLLIPLHEYYSINPRRI